MQEWLRRPLDRWLQACARLVLARHKPLIVGITGTVGKSTVKEMLAAILREDAAVARFGPARVTAGNLNDNSGVPLTVLGFQNFIGGRLKPLLLYPSMPLRAAMLAMKRSYPKLLVLEFGTHRHGHLHELVKLARPNIGVVTTIGTAHLDDLGSLDGVVHEKSALVVSPPPDGAVILGGGHPFVDRLAAMARAPVTVVEGIGYELNFEVARTVAGLLNLSSDTIESGLAKFANPPRRLQRHDLPDRVVIDDSHNANPLSMRYALDVLGDSGPQGARKVAVLGAMAELGTDSERMHVEIGQHARSVADHVVGVGEAARAYEPDDWFADAASCCKRIGDLLRPNDVVLVKGSGSTGMQQVADALVAK